MSDDVILREVHGRVGLIRIHRPQARNALNAAVLNALAAALRDFDDDPSVGAIVIAGDARAFAAGADIREMAEATPVEMLTADWIGGFDALRRVRKPLIAAVSGWCLGGGCELALACDLIVASDSARFGQPEITIGVIPGAGGTQRLARALGKALAMEVVLNNRTLSAEEALQHGLVNRVVPVERFLEEALALAEEIAGRAPLALRLAKQAIDQAFETSLTDGLADERRAFYFLFSTEDQKEGMRAFLEKRPPQWTGR